MGEADRQNRQLDKGFGVRNFSGEAVRHDEVLVLRVHRGVPVCL